MELEFAVRASARLVGNVAGVAAHVEGGVPAPLLRSGQPHCVTLQAEILLFSAGGRLQQLILIVRDVWIVAVEAVANRRQMDLSFYLGSILVAVARQAELDWRGGDQLYVSNVTVGANLVAAQTAGRDGRVDELAFALVFVTLKALGAVGLRIERNGVNAAESRRQT